MTVRACEVCGRTRNVDAHHDDYAKPLDVRWLCRSHHRKLHYDLKSAGISLPGSEREKRRARWLAWVAR